MTHGGDVDSFREEYPGEILDFSANLNPLGLPEPARLAAERSLSDCARYPDPQCRALRRAIARHERVAPEQIVCGAGAAELIFRAVLAERPEKAVVTAPAFSEYEAALRLSGCEIVRGPLTAANDFAVTEDFLDRLTPDVDMAFLCTPNNPTGKAVDDRLLKRIIERCEENRILLALDECFADFLDDPPEPGLPESKSVLVLKAFTKFYAMAGLRLGYCMSRDPGLLERIRESGPPWSVSAPAQAAGAAALSDRGYADATRRLIREERGYLKGGLKALGLSVYGSQANFVFFRAPSDTLREQLKKRGILIRCCADYKGLGAFYYRAAVRTRAENERLLAALGDIL